MEYRFSRGQQINSAIQTRFDRPIRRELWQAGETGQPAAPWFASATRRGQANRAASRQKSSAKWPSPWPPCWARPSTATTRRRWWRRGDAIRSGSWCGCRRPSDRRRATCSNSRYGRRQQHPRERAAGAHRGSKPPAADLTLAREPSSWPVTNARRVRLFPGDW